MYLTVSIDIAHSAKQVFLYVSNYENDPRWRSGVLKMIQSAKPAQIGTRTDEVAIFFGRKTSTPAEVVAYEPGHQIAFAGKTDSGFSVSGNRIVDPQGEYSRFTYQAHIEVTGPLRTIEFLLAAILRRRFKKDLQRLKSFLEAKTPVKDGFSA